MQVREYERGVVEERLEAELIENHLTDERWKEVFLLVAGLSGNRAIDILWSFYNMSIKVIEKHFKICDLLRWVMVTAEESKAKYATVAKRAMLLSAHNNLGMDVALYSDTEIAADIFEAVDAGITIAEATGLDINNENYVKIVTSVAKTQALNTLFETSKRNRIVDQLEEIAAIPAISAPSEEWQEWADKINEFWSNILHFDKASIQFTATEAEALESYLYITYLLICSKDAAVRVPKQAWEELEARLLTV